MKCHRGTWPLREMKGLAMCPCTSIHHKLLVKFLISAVNLVSTHPWSCPALCKQFYPVQFQLKHGVILSMYWLFTNSNAITLTQHFSQLLISACCCWIVIYLLDNYFTSKLAFPTTLSVRNKLRLAKMVKTKNSITDYTAAVFSCWFLTGKRKQLM